MVRRLNLAWSGIRCYGSIISLSIVLLCGWPIFAVPTYGWDVAQMLFIVRSVSCGYASFVQLSTLLFPT